MRTWLCLVAISLLFMVESLAASAVQNIETVEKYAALIVQVGGVGSRVTTKTAWLLTEHAYLDAEKYIKVAFNNGGDIMWVFPAKGYRIKNCTSPTGNRVHIEQNPTGCNILLEDKLKNEILMESEKVGQ